MVPVIACSFLIHSNVEHSWSILILGWIMIAVHSTLTITLFAAEYSIISSIFSLLNISGLLFVIANDYLSLREFFTMSLMAEGVSIVIAVMFFVLFFKGQNGESSWKSLGIFPVILILTIFSAATYPFIKEWLILLKETQVEGIFWIGSLSIFAFAVIKKVSVIGGLVSKVGTQRKKSSKASDSSNESPEGTLTEEKSKPTKDNPATILIPLLLWFLINGYLYYLNQ